jgi:LysM repeat protein
MAGRSPARFLAPLALVAVAVALLMVVNSSKTDSGDSASPGQTTGNQPAATPTGDDNAKPERKGPRRYRVKEGDTPTSIADKTGVPLEEILRLNPDLDPQTLSPGQRIKLRE